MSQDKKANAPTLLLIDDSKIELHALLEMLHERAYSLHVAFDGKEGFERAEILRPDLILLDVTMPHMDGFATCRLLKSSAMTRRIPVIFLTASQELDRRLEGLALGAVDYIVKPFYAEEVIARVQLHLELARSVKAIRPSGLDVPNDQLSQMAPLTDTLTRAAIEILRLSLWDPPGNEALAQLVGISKRALNEAFQAEFSLTVSGWLREERLRTARHLIVTTDTPMLAISDHLGFATQSNFAKAFRQRFSFTPTEARARMRGKAET